MPSDPLNEKAIFNVARTIGSPEARDAYLRQVCGEDAGLIDRVTALLQGLEKQESFLESPAALANTIGDLITEKAGTQIGPYKLLQQIGEGGMGVVYMAEQKEPVKRRVALKIIKPGMDTRQVIARFEAERQALAMMDHPNIAKVLDAGATESGRPYFVMELVNGLPVTKYCDEQHLTPKERLELFIPICQAVQHAHHKGIIHRDLKPSNILVARYDDRVVPKVIDFGVAKATSQTLSEKTIFTQLGQVIGTLEYMSPEQAQRNQLDVDTRSDIYSLGVLLYELLTGETPFDAQRLRSAAFDEMLRIIREEEPSKPSTKVSNSRSLPSIAANRRIEPTRLGTIIRGELDWIVMKALEKDRSRRYDTASTLGQDIQRFLNDEAVVACPPSAAYRFSKFARRNRTVLATSAILAFVLLGGTIISGWQAIRASQQARRAVSAERLAAERLEREQAALAEVRLERDRALEAEGKAEERFDIAADAVKHYLNEVTLDQQLQNADFRELRKRLLESALPFYEELIQQKPEDDDQRLQQASAHGQLHRIYYYFFADFEAALHHAEQSALICEELASEAPENSVLQRRLASAYTILGMSHSQLGNRQQRDEYSKQALEITRELANKHPEVDSYQKQLATTLGNRSVYAQDREESVRLRKEAIAILDALHEKSPDDPGYWGGLSWWLWNMSDDLESLQRSLELREKLAERFPDVIKYREFVGLSLTSLGHWYAKHDELETAIDFHTRALEIREELVEVMPKPMYVEHLVETHGDLAALKFEQEEFESAENHLTRALEVDPENTYAYKVRAEFHRRTGKPESALADLNRAIELKAGSRDLYSDRAKLRIEVLEQYKEGIADCEQALRIDPQYVTAIVRRASAFRRLEEYESAARDAVAALKIQPNRTWAWQELKRITQACQSPQQLAVLDDLHEYVKENPASFAAHIESLAEIILIRAQLHFDKGLAEQMNSDCDVARHLAPESAKIWRRCGRLQKAAGNWSQALADYTAALELDPQDSLALNARSVVHCRLRNVHAAVQDSNSAIEIDPQLYMYVHRAWPLILLGRHEEAIADCNRALEHDPDDAPTRDLHALARNRRAWARELLGQMDLAVADAVAAVMLQPSPMLHWGRLRQCARKVHDPEHLATIDELHQHLNTDAKLLSSHAESLAELYLIRAELLANQGDAQKAISDSATATEIAPESPLVFRKIGDLHAAAGRWKEAIDAYSRALDFDEKDVTAIQWMGISLLASGENAAYRKHCREMLKRHAATEDRAVAGAVAKCFTYHAWPEADLTKPLALAALAADESESNAWNHYCYGALLYRAGRYEEARERLSEALTCQADKPHGNMLFYMAMTRHALGDSEQARQAFEQGEKWLAEQQSPRPIPNLLCDETKQLLSEDAKPSHEPALSRDTQ